MAAEEAVDRLRRSFDASALCVVQTARGRGTGFAFLEPGMVVTAKHVAAGHAAGPIRLWFRPDRALPARLLFADPRVDLAVLEVAGEPPDLLPLRPHDGPVSTGRLRCAGYKPSLSDPASGCYTTFVSDVEWYELSRRQRDGHEEALFILRVPEGEPGHSGGPLLTPDGAVVAVVVDGITLDGQHLLRATSILPVLDYLRARRLPSPERTSIASPNSCVR